MRLALEQYFGISVHGNLVHIVRSPLPMPAPIVDVRAIFDELAAALLPHAGKRALLDLRLGPGRNDDDFEQASLQMRLAILRSFTRVALLVKTAAGKLQVKRLSGGAGEIFQDEAEARRYLAAP